MQYDAIILAGGENTSELKKIAPYDNEALIIIGNYPMIYYVHKALRSSPLIRNIVISGPVEALSTIFNREERLFFVDGGDNAIESFILGIRLLREREVSSRVLILPTDIPFITTAAIEDFLKQCEKNPAEFHYPITSKLVNEAKFPGVSRTYVKLKEGIFTGGNLFLVKESIIDQISELALQLVERRKNPLAIARLFGLKIVLQLLTGRLTLRAAENRLYKVAGVKGRAIISDYAEVGVDVDKPSDLELAQKYLKEAVF